MSKKKKKVERLKIGDIISVDMINQTVQVSRFFKPLYFADRTDNKYLCGGITPYSLVQIIAGLSGYGYRFVSEYQGVHSFEIIPFK